MKRGNASPNLPHHLLYTEDITELREGNHIYTKADIKIELASNISDHHKWFTLSLAAAFITS
jgi:hypothetical protein